MAKYIPYSFERGTGIVQYLSSRFNHSDIGVPPRTFLAPRLSEAYPRNLHPGLGLLRHLSYLLGAGLGGGEEGGRRRRRRREWINPVEKARVSPIRKSRPFNQKAHRSSPSCLQQLRQVNGPPPYPPSIHQLQQLIKRSKSYMAFLHVTCAEEARELCEKKGKENSDWLDNSVERFVSRSHIPVFEPFQSFPFFRGSGV